MMWANLFLLVAIVHQIEMANILALLPFPLYSHTLNFMPIFKALAARGHNVTVVSPFPQKKPVPNLHDIDVDMKFADIAEPIDLTKVSERLFQLSIMWKFGDQMSKKAVTNEAVLNLYKDEGNKFDLIILETFIFQESLLAFGHKFKAPVININPSILPASASYYTGNQLPISYSPTRFSSFTDHMTFLQRVETFFFHTYEFLMNRLYFINVQDRLMRQHLQQPGQPDIPPLIDMLKNTSLTLIHHNSAIGYPLPFHTNVIEFGGINVKSEEKLPNDLQQIMDNATDGVIYFSFGSFYNLTMLSPSIQNSILSAIGKVKQKVLIKWGAPENEQDLQVAANVVMRSWFPQAGILGHPNCKLFITHGGIASLMEAVYHAVPILAIPLFADQNYNAKFAEINGLGKTLRLTRINEEKLLNSINSVLYNPRYKENIAERSSIFKDVPMNTLNNAIYWIEYVIRHKGAPHLRPAVLDLYWFQELMLDIILFYFIILFLIIFIIKITICFIYRCLKYLISGNYNVKKERKSKKE